MLLEDTANRGSRAAIKTTEGLGVPRVATQPEPNPAEYQGSFSETRVAIRCRFLKNDRPDIKQPGQG